MRPDLKGHRAVTLRGPADFAARDWSGSRSRHARATKPPGLSFADRFDLTAAGASGTFEFDFVDPAKHTFELRIKRVFRNGLSAQTDWQRFDQDDVTIAAD